MILKGKVHKFGDNINTDDIIAAKYLDSQDEAYLGSKCMENLDASFAKRVAKGDIMVGGNNFGCGSSREHAPVSIKGCGISAVVAGSFARIFFRNAINIGLPLMECPQAVDGINNGNQLEVDLERGIIKNLTTGETFQAKPYPDFMRNIIQSGGLIEYTRQKLAAG